MTFIPGEDAEYFSVPAGLDFSTIIFPEARGIVQRFSGRRGIAQSHSGARWSRSGQRIGRWNADLRQDVDEQIWKLELETASDIVMNFEQ